ncbi:MAG: Asp-tRNA(Asn)/Glu-tRNA(Gln) amidotransferase subunit GatA [Candidatus Syntropharchaeia archaeon]
MDCEERMWKIFDRIKKSKLNAFITLNEEEALKKAREIDKNGEAGKLSGIPIAIKDSISTKGLRTTCASKILENYIPPYDAHVIEELKRNGAIIIGKTNMDEFSMGSSTETSYFGPTKNPWDLERVPGGSSGGSAAAVASGEADMALGSDTGGSIRCPASFCGIVGLKATYGLISRYGLIAYANSLEGIGPMAKNVHDTALLLEVISTKDERDSTQIGSEGGYLNSLREDVSDIRIGVPKEFFGEGVHPEVEKSVWNAVHLLEELGAEYEEVEMPSLRYALASYYVIAMSEASSNLARFDGLRYGPKFEGNEDWHTTFSKIRAEGFGKEVKRRILLGTYALSAGYYGKYYLKALKVRTLIKNDFERILKDFNVLLTPTMPFPAFKIGERIKDPLSLYMADVNTVPVNLAGVPSISIPCGFCEGLPVGLGIIGRYFDEKTILRVAFTFERNTDYNERRIA